LAMGPRDLGNGTVEVARRDLLTKEVVAVDGIENHIAALLDNIQESIFNKAAAFREELTTEANSWDEFVNLLDNKGGFISAHWDGTPETEEKIKELTKATIRCIPIDAVEENGKCILTGNPSSKRVLFARAY